MSATQADELVLSVLHVQALLPAIEFEFGPHAVQLPGPVDALNLPASQFTHTPGPADVLYLPG